MRWPFVVALVLVAIAWTIWWIGVVAPECVRDPNWWCFVA